jgi:hypothetical protein
MNKETKELEGIKWNLLFYFPLGEKKLHAQIYDKITEDVIVEEIIKTQEDYDFAIEVFTMANENIKKINQMSELFVNGFQK